MPISAYSGSPSTGCLSTMKLDLLGTMTPAGVVYCMGTFSYGMSMPPMKVISSQDQSSLSVATVPKRCHAGPPRADTKHLPSMRWSAIEILRPLLTSDLTGHPPLDPAIRADAREDEHPPEHAVHAADKGGLHELV